MSDEEIAAAAKAAIAETGAAGVKDMGKVMGVLARAPRRGHRHGPRRRRREAAARVGAVIASEAKQSRCGRRSADRDCFGAALLAMTGGSRHGLSARVSRRIAQPASRWPIWSAGGCGWSGAGASIRRAVPVPQREDAVLLRRRGQGVFSLLRLRRAWRCDRLCHARRQSRLYRGGRAAGRRGRDCGAAADPAGARAGAAPEDAARSAGRRGRVLRGAALGGRPGRGRANI